MKEKTKQLIENNQKMQEEVDRKKQIREREQTSRLIVFNVPNYITEKKLAEHFQTKGNITDCKIMRKGNKSRKFAFIGYRDEKEAKIARDFFNNTFIDTSQITVEFAKTHDDPNLPRGWSKYTKGTLAYERLHKDEPKERKAPISKVEAEERKEVENKKKKFKEFVAVMMAKGKKSKTQSWNDSFVDFVPTDVTKSRRERKKEEKMQKELKDKELQETKAQEEQSSKVVQTKKVIQTESGATIVEKEIHKKSSKLGKNKSKQVHIKFGNTVDIGEALENVDLQDQTAPPEPQPAAKEENEDEGEEIDENRLYIMNLPFAITETELRGYLGKYGEIEDVSIPLRKGGIGMGFAFVRFTEPESAVNAYAN